MPYAKPPASPESNHYDLPPLKLRPKHRRTRSATPVFSDERGPGAFISLPNLPRRKSHSSSERKTLFHFNDQDSDSSESSSPPPEPSSDAVNALRLIVDTKNVPSNAPSLPRTEEETSSLPFPTRGSPVHSPLPPASAPSSTSAFSLPRTPSTPIILSNGKPLKPSLKSSHSSPHVPGVRLHFRAQSEPATPAHGAITPKNVHFAGDETLRSVKLFNSSSKPANVSRTNADDTETETEYDSTAALETNGYPFPRTSLSSETFGFGLDSQSSSPIPAVNPPSRVNVYAETLVLPRDCPPVLHGSILVRNLAFAKEVAVRFTLDNWQTTSEVICKHVVSLPSLPRPFPSPNTFGDHVANVLSNTWDRFSFVIRLEDFERKLHEKTMWFVVRYTAPGIGEWWDNNLGKNYCVKFVKLEGVGHRAHTNEKIRTSPVIGNSQQRTFSAPSTLKGTPTTEAFQAVAHGPRTTQPKISLPSVPTRDHRISLPQSHASPPARHTSSLQPLLKENRPTSIYSSLPTKLNLLNYAAPSSSATPRVGTPSGQFVGLSEATVTPPTPTQQSMNVVGGMPATAPQYEVWPISNSPSEQSLTDTTPPPLYSALPMASDSDKQRAKDIVTPSASSLASDSTYAAFVKHWCFVQSPTPSPSIASSSSGGNTTGNGNNTRPVAQIPGSSWRGIGVDALRGLGLRSESPMLTSM